MMKGSFGSPFSCVLKAGMHCWPLASFVKLLTLSLVANGCAFALNMYKLS